jgi:hypothetical protein
MALAAIALTTPAEIHQQAHARIDARVCDMQQRQQRSAQMDVYQGRRQPRANDWYVPHRIDALGVYQITGPGRNFAPHPVEGFYAVDDFGQLVRIDAQQLLVTAFN